MNPELLEDATIRLLKVLGELTPDTEINNAITAMNVAGVRIRRLENELAERWYNIEGTGTMPIVGGWYDVYPYVREGDRTVRELYFAKDDLGDDVWLSSTGNEWDYPVTHWRERPAGPEDD